MGGMGGPRSALWSKSPITTVHRAGWSRTERWSRDSWKLLVAFWNSALSPPPSALSLQSPSSSSLRDIVWQQAAEHNNQVARQVLQWEREVNLLRYYGPRGYLREKRKSMGAGSSNNNNNIVSRWFFNNNNHTQRLASTLASGSDVSAAGASTPTNAAEASSTPADNNETNTIISNTMEQEASLVPAPPVVAKIPFMITARMRQELIELGYEPSQIATLIPLQAMLLLDHHVTPATMELDLPQLLQAHEAQQRQIAAEHARKQQQEQELLEQQQQTLEAAEAAQETERAASHSAEQSTTLVHIPSEVPQPAELTPAEAVLVEAPFAAEPALVQGTTWHQVIEIMAPTNEDEEDTSTNNSTTTSATNNNVVGMFLDRQEAEFARSVHEDLAVERSARQNKDSHHHHHHGSTRPSTFEIRTIVKD